MNSRIAELRRPLRRAIKPERGKPFVVTVFPSGWIEVRPKFGRRGSERCHDLRGAWSGQLTLPTINAEP